ncbi:MAG: alpha/beta hydrolase [Planctomycetes bacterium]|nr:alpha/beta hydrolase [Planctomycetota bacterium]
MHRAAVRSPGILLVAVALGAGPLAFADPEQVSFYTEDGVRIFADYYAPAKAAGGAPMAILLHMYKHDRSSWKPLASVLQKRGFATLAIDMRGHGESATTEAEKRVENRDTALFKDMYEDVRGAYDWLARQEGVDRARFALVGASVGCSVALRYAAQDKSVDALVCLTPGVEYLGLDSKRDIRKIVGRKMLLMATADERAACDELKPLTDGVGVRVFEGQAHGTRMFGVVSGIESEVAEFLSDAVGPPAKTTVFGSINSHIYHPSDSGWISRIKPPNLRFYSSPAEAEARGLRETKSMGPRDKPRFKREQEEREP